MKFNKKIVVYLLFVFSLYLGEFAQATVEKSPELITYKSPSQFQRDYKHFTSVVQLSKKYRLNPKYSASKDDKRRQKILNEIQSFLPDMGNHSQVIEIVAAFVNDYFEQDAVNYEIVDSWQTSEGKGEHEVFFLLDKKGRKQFVVKAFPNPWNLSSDFLPEISSLTFLNSMSFTQVLPVYPLAAVQGTSDEVTYGFLLQTAATGKNISAIIGKHSSIVKSSAERDQMVKHLERALTLLGEGLAELHAVKSSKGKSLSEFEVKSLKKHCDSCLKHSFIYSSLENAFKIKTFKAYIDSRIQAIQDTQYFLSYQYGDCNLSNVFYDENLDKIYFIDAESLFSSLSLYGKPLGHGEHDLAKVEHSLLTQSAGLITQEELQFLQNCFHNAYNTKYLSKSSLKLFNFYTDSYKLSHLIWYADYNNLKDEVVKKRNQIIFEAAIRHFQVKLGS